MNAELRAAFEADDRERADYERWQYKQQQQASMIRRDASAVPDVVYKINPHALQHPQQQVTAEDAEAAAKWDAWCDRRITGYVDPLLKREMLAMQREVLDLAEEVGTTTGRLERELRGEIAKLRTDIELQRQVGELRTEIEKLKAKSDGA